MENELGCLRRSLLHHGWRHGLRRHDLSIAGHAAHGAGALERHSQREHEEGPGGGRHGGWVVAAVDAAGDNPAVMRRAAVGAGACALVLEGTVGNWQER